MSTQATGRPRTAGTCAYYPPDGGPKCENCWVFPVGWPKGKRSDKLRLKISPLWPGRTQSRGRPENCANLGLNPPHASQDAENLGFVIRLANRETGRKVEGPTYAPSAGCRPKAGRKIAETCSLDAPDQGPNAKLLGFSLRPTGKRKDKLRGSKVLALGLAGNRPKADLKTAETWALYPPQASQDTTNLRVSHKFGQPGNRRKSSGSAVRPFGPAGNRPKAGPQTAGIWAVDREGRPPGEGPRYRSRPNAPCSLPLGWCGNGCAAH